MISKSKDRLSDADGWIDGGIYPRLSDERGIRGDVNSIDNQEIRSREFCATEKIRVVEVYTDRGWSGRKSKRPEWMRMHQDIESGRIKAVVAYKLERCARDTAEGIRFIDLCIKHNCRLISVTEHIDIYTPLGRKNAIDLLSCAEYESRNTGSKVSNARETYAQQGYKNGGKYPPGFRKSSKPRIPEHDPFYAKILLEVFESVAIGIALLDIEKDLLKRGIVTPVYEITKRGGEKDTHGGRPFRADQLERFIRNPMYKGYVSETHRKPGQPETHTFVKGKFEPIVSEELWAAANKVLDDAKREGEQILQERDKWFHPLKGILKCGVCGSAMSPSPASKRDSTGKPYLYYRCRGAEENRKACQTPIKQLPAALIEDLIYDYLGKMADHPDVIDALVGASQKGKTSKIRKLGSEIKSLNKELKTIEEEIGNLTEVAAKIGIKGFSKDLKDRVEEASSKREDILANIHRCRREQKALKDESDYRKRIQEGLKEFRNAMRNLSEEEQRELVQLVIDVIHIHPLSERSEVGGQRMRLEIHLRMGALVRSESQKGRKLKVNLDVTLNRGKAVWASAKGDVSLEIRKPEPSKSKRKPPRMTGFHEILRADKILKTMEKKSWSAADYARSEGLTRSAISQAMRWHKLSPDCQKYLRKLTAPKVVRKCSSRLLRELLKLPPKEQFPAMLRAINGD